MLEFRRTTDFPRTTLQKLLQDAYSFNPEFESIFGASWREFDDFFFDNPQIADKYGFISTLDGLPVGLASWDPRNLPDYVIFGHNCIASQYKGRGLGKQQIHEAVSRILDSGTNKIIVTTNELLLPAQRMYEGVGFVKCRVRDNPETGHFAGRYIDYELTITR